MAFFLNDDGWFLASGWLAGERFSKEQKRGSGVFGVMFIIDTGKGEVLNISCHIDAEQKEKKNEQTNDENMNASYGIYL